MRKVPVDQKDKEKEEGGTIYLSPSQAEKIWQYSLWVPALLGGAGGLLPPLLEGWGRQRSEPEPGEYDIDVDLSSPKQIRRMRRQILERAKNRQGVEKESMDKSAEGDNISPIAWMPVAGLLSTLGGGLSYYAGNELADSILSGQTSENLEEARRKFKKALLREQLAAARKGEGAVFTTVSGPGQEYPKAASMEKEAMDPLAPFKWVLGPIGDKLKELGASSLSTAGGIGFGVGIPAGAASYYLLKDYLKSNHPDWQRYRTARNALGRRISGSTPYAELKEDFSEEDRELLEEALREQMNLKGQDKGAAWPFDQRGEDDQQDEEDDQLNTPSDVMDINPRQLTEEEDLLPDFPDEFEAARKRDREPRVMQQARENLFG